MPESASELASLYERLIHKRAGEKGRCRDQVCRRDDLPDEITLQCLWLDGQFGISFTDDEGNSVNILDPGEWNKGAGPDFLNAKIEINGELRHGDIELDASPEDWERHGHGGNPAFSRVILHATCLPPSKTWFTRNHLHERIPRIELPDNPTFCEQALSHPSPGAGTCLNLWDQEDRHSIDRILRMAAAYRFHAKKRKWKRKSAIAGEDQALYENMAETLGYSANKIAMGALARRMKLKTVCNNPEPLLFGAAGFLVPSLPSRCSTEARNYHKQLWDFWWICRSDYEPIPSRAISWTFSGIRPTNHPQRRLGALAIIVSRWDEFSSLCRSGSLKELEAWFSSLSHLYWDTHTTLPSAELKNKVALVGSSRVADFAVNHLFPMRDDDESWEAYLRVPGAQPNAKTTAMIHRISASPDTAKFFLSKAYRQQALLQIREDFCLISPCSACPLPHQAPHWGLEIK